jgi:glycosyltransferase involved in cell wall biosynthesis
MIGRTLYSWESRRHIEQLLQDHQPDLAHLQSIEHHISPSILHSFRKYNIPVVQSINTYKLICASYRLFLLEETEICERCLFGKHYHAVQTRCVKNSLPASFLAMLEMYLHQVMKIYHLVDRFIVSNNFMAEKLKAAGYAEQKIIKLLNPLTIDNFQTSENPGDYILYFGRLDPEKGVATLVQAMARLPQLKLVIVGNGSQMPELQQWVKEHKVPNIEFAGPKWGDALIPYLLGAKLVVVPSIWYEPSPYVIYQSLASGKPIVASNIGGIPDLITEETGLLVKPGSVSDLAANLESIAFDVARLKQMRQAARHWAEQNLDPEIYYAKLMRLYETVIDEYDHSS